MALGLSLRQPTLLGVCGLCLALCVACAPLPPRPVAPADSNQTVHESCTKACNQEYARCNDKAPTSFPGDGMPREVLGASAECKKDLRDCLASCF